MLIPNNFIVILYQIYILKTGQTWVFFCPRSTRIFDDVYQKGERWVYLQPMVSYFLVVLSLQMPLEWTWMEQHSFWGQQSTPSWFHFLLVQPFLSYVKQKAPKVSCVILSAICESIWWQLRIQNFMAVFAQGGPLLAGICVDSLNLFLEHLLKCV